MSAPTQAMAPATMPTPTATRVAAAASALFAVSLFLTVATVNVPRDATDDALLSWWQQASNRASGLISGALAVLTAVLFAVVMNYVRALPAAARAPRWLAFARSMGAAATATLLVSGALRGVVGHMVETLDDPLPDIGLLRYSTALNYLLFGLPLMTVLALTIAAVSIVVLRTGALGRWVAYVGIPCATVILTAVAIWKQPAH